MSKKDKGDNAGFLRPLDPEDMDPPGYLLALKDSRYMVSFVAELDDVLDENVEDSYCQEFVIFDSSIEATNYYDSLLDKEGVSGVVISVVVDRDQFVDEAEDTLSREEISKEIKYHKAFEECYYIYMDEKFYSSDCKEDLVDKVLDAICRAGKKPPQ